MPSQDIVRKDLLDLDEGTGDDWDLWDIWPSAAIDVQCRLPIESSSFQKKCPLYGLDVPVTASGVYSTALPG